MFMKLLPVSEKTSLTSETTQFIIYLMMSSCHLHLLLQMRQPDPA
jgi:hypothetical protein